ncbi:hypothetical protein AORI_1964 [Amycolatopsis keratiniphila]|uniref:Uncharacterized protein n=1 Tax=Amycolatopsis keratiniphila TaxID=129921 RepID=R4T0M0_9PSEU|nr:hypothetical protein AORI_1964 [Amycolatopsis keratiniphila]
MPAFSPTAAGGTFAAAYVQMLEDLATDPNELGRCRMPDTAQVRLQLYGPFRPDRIFPTRPQSSRSPR